MNSINEESDNYFLMFYTFEFLIKVLAFGFIINDNAYLRDFWNVLDLFIISVGWSLIYLRKILI